MRKFSTIDEIQKAVAANEYLGDVVQLENVIYEIVYYSEESSDRKQANGKVGSRIVTFYCSETEKEINLDYNTSSAYIGDTTIDWNSAHGRTDKIGEVIQPCMHRTQSRVRTHRGSHCGDCGKQF